jgi:hypothetical protein
MRARRMNVGVSYLLLVYYAGFLHFCTVGLHIERIFAFCRSQWLRVLRHELSSPARTLGSWVLISLKAWMFVCVRIGSGPATG